MARASRRAWRPARDRPPFARRSLRHGLRQNARASRRRRPRHRKRRRRPPSGWAPSVPIHASRWRALASSTSHRALASRDEPYQLKRTPTEPYRRVSSALPLENVLNGAVVSSPPLTWPTSPTILSSSRLIEASAKYVERFIELVSANGPKL